MEQEPKTAEELQREKVFALMRGSANLADWIYHDMRLNCDSMAAVRTAHRLRQIADQHGQETLFGLAGWWAVRAFGRLRNAHAVAGIAKRPDLLPTHIEELMQTEDDVDKKRAVITAQQFISTITHQNFTMAQALFDVVYEAGPEAFVPLLFSVLTFSINISDKAEMVKNGQLVHVQ